VHYALENVEEFKEFGRDLDTGEVKRLLINNSEGIAILDVDSKEQRQLVKCRRYPEMYLEKMRDGSIGILFQNNFTSNVTGYSMMLYTPKLNS
jgi:hypothetical protein